MRCPVLPGPSTSPGCPRLPLCLIFPPPYHGLSHLALPLPLCSVLPSESHFLTQLHSLKMLSITPSQLENGKKITTYDYRWAVPQVAPWETGGWSWMASRLIFSGENGTNAVSERRYWGTNEMAEGRLFPNTRSLTSWERWCCVSLS